MTFGWDSCLQRVAPDCSGKPLAKLARENSFSPPPATSRQRVGAGLLRQDHQIDYQVLQGELKSLSILLHGPGEILDVQGSNIVAWKVTGEGDDRQLDATLSQPITAASQIKIRSQTPLGAFPVRVEGLRLNPVGAIRHSGYLRLTNLGSVRLEPTGLTGLTSWHPSSSPASPSRRGRFLFTASPLLTTRSQLPQIVSSLKSTFPNWFFINWPKPIV